MMSKELGNEFWMAVSKDSKTMDGQLVLLRHAAIAAAFCNDKWINAADVRKMLSKENRPAATKVEQMLLQMRNIIDKKLSAEQSVQVRDLLDSFQDGLVMSSVQKKPKGIEDIIVVPESHAAIFVAQVKDRVGVELTTAYDGYYVEPSPIQSGPASSKESTSGTSTVFLI